MKHSPCNSEIQLINNTEVSKALKEIFEIKAHVQGPLVKIL